MPAPVRDLIVSPTTTPVRIELEPALNAIHSLVLVAKTDDLSGLGEWVTRTSAAMTNEEVLRHRLVMIGFFFAVVPRQRWPSFPAYLDHLATMPPLALRDKLLTAYETMPCIDDETVATPVDLDEVLASAGSYLDFLDQRFSPEYIDRELETKAYSYVVDPVAMQTLIVSHLRHMWTNYLADEWENIYSMLSDAVTAFQQVDFVDMDRLAIAEFITDQDLSTDHWRSHLDGNEKLIFIPSAHAGPYLGKYLLGDSLAIVFGARLPEGTHFVAPDLSRAEVLVRLSALADDTRLRILRLVAEDGEQRSQDIMQQLSLSQSAASRHLKQLSATGYLIERRCEGAKCYSLNPDRIESTLNAVSTYLLARNGKVSM